jgi:hypothetical protein
MYLPLTLACVASFKLVVRHSSSSQWAQQVLGQQNRVVSLSSHLDTGLSPPNPTQPVPTRSPAAAIRYRTLHPRLYDQLALCPPLSSIRHDPTEFVIGESVPRPTLIFFNT